MTPSVTALVSAYFAEEFLKGRIENLLQQIGIDLCVLVICQEDSPEHAIIKEFGSEEAVTVFTTPGIPPLYVAWNYLIEHANTEFLTNANCDDRLYDGALELLAKTLTTHPKCSVAYADDDIVIDIGGYPVNRHLWIQGGFNELVKGCFVGPMPMWRAELHKKHGLFDKEMVVAGDYEFWLRITKAGERLVHVPQVVGAYLKRHGLEKANSVRTLWESARARSRYVDWKTYPDIFY